MTRPAHLSLRGAGVRLPAPGARWLFRGLDLALAPGRTHVVVGPNGAGKTTLLRTCAGLRPVSEGTVRLGEHDLAQTAPRERARALAYLPQTTPLVENLDVRELVMLGRTPHLGSFAGPRPEDAAAVATALARAGVAHLAARPVFTLSGGEYQRVRIARLLATGAPTLLLDEPTAALDVAAALRIVDLLRELAAAGHALLVVLHDLQLARRLADHALCLPGPASRAQGAAPPTPHVGPADQVLTPKVLEPIFGVRITPYPDALAYHLPPEPSPPTD